MSLQRREFLGASVATAAWLAAARAEARAAQDKPAAAAKKLDLLILGGTGLIGPALVEAALKRGHKVTLFNRGKTRTHLFPDLEKLRGDRDPLKGEGIKALEGRKFDAVFDDNGYYPRIVKASAELMSPNIGHYFYVSSISCYAKNDVEGADETSACGTMEDPTLENMGDQFQYYGPLKALCEQEAEKACPKKTTIIRPGYIVGPGDGSGRFAYWPVRCDRGGEVVVPGAPTDPIQVIDVRDLAQFMVHLAEQRNFGVFNACGPEKRLPWGDVIAACQKASSAKDLKIKWMSLELLEKHKDAEALKTASWEIWSPYAGDSKGFHTWSNARAVKAGLTFRPIETIVRDTLAWWKALPDDDRAKRIGGLKPEQEAQILKLLAQG